MSMLDVKKRLAHWRSLLEKNDYNDLLTALEESPVVEVTDFLAEQSIDTSVLLFLQLKRNKQASIFSHFPGDKQLDIYRALEVHVFASIFEQMPSDLRADFYTKLDETAQVKLIPFLAKKVRQDVITLSRYAPDKAGGIMSTDFVAVGDESTVASALDSIREEAPSKKMMYSIYVVDKARKLVGIVDLKDLVLAKPAEKVMQLANETIVFADLSDDQEEVANKIEKYDLMALPILNSDGQIVGVASVDNALHVIREEEKEDMEKFMGIRPNDHNHTYMGLSTIQHFKKRAGWVIFLFFLGILQTLVMHTYEKTIHALAFVSCYLMTISDTGGNVGSQTATMVVRAISLGEISVKHWLAVLWKELKIACLLASSLFIIGIGKISAISCFFDRPGYPSPMQIGLAVSLAVSMQVFSSILIGALLPLFVKKIGKDPAAVASPAITSIVDIIGLFIYLGIIHAFFKT